MTDERRKRIGLGLVEVYTESALQYKNKFENNRLADLDRHKAMGMLMVLYTIGLIKESEYNERIEKINRLFDKKEAATVAETP